RPCRALPRPHRLSGGQSRCKAATAPGSGGRLRSRARFLVQGIDAASAAAAHSAQAEAAADARRLAAGMQIDRAGAVTDAETTALSRVSGNPVIANFCLGPRLRGERADEALGSQSGR